MEKLPKDIIFEILHYLGPRDLYRYASTDKQASIYAGVIWKKRSISKQVLLPEETDWYWYRSYMKEVNHTAYSLISTIYDTFTRFKNKKVFNKYLKTHLYIGVLKMFKNTPCYLQLKSVNYDKLDLERIMLNYQHTSIGYFVESYFQIAYGSKYNDLFSYGLEYLFVSE